MTQAANTTEITKEVIDGVAYFTTIRKGTKYTTYFSTVAKAWFVSTQRLALGRFTGAGKYFKNIADCKPFAALPVLISLNAI